MFRARKAIRVNSQQTIYTSLKFDGNPIKDHNNQPLGQSFDHQITFASFNACLHYL